MHCSGVAGVSCDQFRAASYVINIQLIRHICVWVCNYSRCIDYKLEWLAHLCTLTTNGESTLCKLLHTGARVVDRADLASAGCCM